MSLFSTEECAFVSHNKSLMQFFSVNMQYEMFFFSFLLLFYCSPQKCLFLVPASTGNANGNS